MGMTSREQVAFEDLSIAMRTSSVEAGKKWERQGGGIIGAGSGTNATLVGKLDDNLVILSLKNLRKEEARVVGDVKVGNLFGEELVCRESM